MRLTQSNQFEFSLDKGNYAYSIISFITIFLFILTISCNGDGNEVKMIRTYERNKIKPKSSLILSKSLSFKLDSLTTPELESVCYFEDTINNQPLKILAILNNNINSIYYYNTEDKALLSIQKLAKDGPNGMGVATSIYLDSMDSIYVFNYPTSTIFLINRASKIIDKYEINLGKKNIETNSIYYPYPKLNNMSPMLKHGNKLYMSGYTAGELDNETKNNRPVLIVFDIVKKIPSML